MCIVMQNYLQLLMERLIFHYILHYYWKRISTIIHRESKIISKQDLLMWINIPKYEFKICSIIADGSHREINKNLLKETLWINKKITINNIRSLCE